MIFMEEAKTVVEVNTVINSGSTGHIAEDIGRASVDLGFKAYFAYGRNPKASSLVPLKIGTKAGVCLHVLFSRLFDAHGLLSTFATRRFVKKLDKIKPDILHLHNIHGYYLNYSLLFKWIKAHDVKVIWTLHDSWSYTGHCAYYTALHCDKWMKGCGHCMGSRSYPSSLCDRSEKNWQIKRQCFTGVKDLTIVTPSLWLKEDVEKSFLQGYDVKVINNGVDTEVFKPVCHKDRDCLILGVASVWEKRKGLEDFIAMAGLLQPGEHIVLVGLAKEQLEQLPKGITGLCRTESQAELAALYSRATVFVNPTYEENFPTTNLEALASGTPVITYEGTGSVESVSDGTGFVVKTGDVKAVMDCVRKVYKDKEGYVQSCRAKALALYDKKLMIERYMELYKA